MSRPDTTTVIRVATRVLLLAAAMLVLSACGRGMDDLNAYIDEVKARPGGRIEPLPEIAPPPTHTYTARTAGMRSPFRPDEPQVSRDTGVGAPDRDRPREYLEQFPLDTMRMVGSLDMGDARYALVQTQEGLVHRVSPGNYMGQNDGRVLEISGSEIRLVEIVADGMGGYMERPASVALRE